MKARSALRGEQTLDMSAQPSERSFFTTALDLSKSEKTTVLDVVKLPKEDKGIRIKKLLLDVFTFPSLSSGKVISG